MTDTASKKQLRKPEYLSPAQLAHVQGCSERTVREWCKRGFIEEAYRTEGRHWRIRTPLSGKTRLELEKWRGDWPFKDGAGDLQGNWEPELAESLLVAQLYQRDIERDIDEGVPVTAELVDLLQQRLLGEEPTDENGRRVRRIQEEIIRRLETRKPLWNLLVLGWVYQLSLKDQRLPTVEEVAERMWLSRPALYRRKCSAKTIAKAYRVAIGDLRRALPGADELDSAQRANRKAKKAPRLWKPRAVDRVRNSKQS